jgi:hypothetical protein
MDPQQRDSDENSFLQFTCVLRSDEQSHPFFS